MVSIKDIAQVTGYSVATISRYLNNSGYVSQKAACSIEKAINDYHYKPNYIARNLVTQKSNTVGLLIPSINNPFLMDFVEGVEEESSKTGYNIFLCHSRDDAETESRYLKLLLERRVDGIILFPVSAKNPFYNEVSHSIPMLSVIRKIEGAGIASIILDDYNGGYRIAEYIIQKGHRKIAFINGTQNLSTGRERWRGTKAAADDYGLEIDDNLVVFVNFSIQNAYTETMRILKGSRPTAVCAAGQLLSLGAMKAIKELGLCIPADISLIAFDGIDGTYYENFIEPKITANKNEYKEMGKIAFIMMIDEIEEKKKKHENTKTKDVVISLNIEERDSVKVLSKINHKYLEKKGKRK